MKITIQAIKQRAFNVEKIQKYLKGQAEVFYDDEMKGPFHSFKEMLSIPFDGYRLHLQDDVILQDRFLDYLEVLQGVMTTYKMDVLSLYVPNRKRLFELYCVNERFAVEKNLGLPAVIFSKFVIQKMIDFLPYTKETYDDDSFMWECLKANDIKSYVHLPSLVQHNVNIKSSVGHANNKTRMSMVFDPNYIKEYFERQYEKLQ